MFLNIIAPFIDRAALSLNVQWTSHTFVGPGEVTPFSADYSGGMDAQPTPAHARVARQPGRSVVLVHVLALASAAGAIALTNGWNKWDPWPLAVIATFTIVSGLTYVESGSARVKVSGTPLGLMLAAVLLGGGPAAIVGIAHDRVRVAALAGGRPLLPQQPRHVRLVSARGRAVLPPDGPRCSTSGPSRPRLLPARVPGVRDRARTELRRRCRLPVLPRPLLDAGRRRATCWRRSSARSCSRRC